MFRRSERCSSPGEVKMKLFFAAILVLASMPAQAAQSFAFKVDISFSPKAAAKLAELHEGVVGAAYYHGLPAPAARKHADDVGQINLDVETVTVEPTQKTISFTGKVVRRKLLSWVAKRQVLVTVNVYSARRSGPDNLLNCTFYDGPVATAAAKPPQIACKLIAGE